MILYNCQEGNRKTISDRNRASETLRGKEKDMNEEMNQAEIAREETEQKMIYKFLLMVKEEKEKGGNLEELEKQIEAMIK